MLLAFAEKTLSGLVFSFLLVGIATYFGQPFVFDPIVLIAIVAIAVAFRRNRDLLTILAALILERGIEELMWRFMENTIWFKIPAYLILSLICLFFAKGFVRVFLLVFFAISVGSEVLWYLTEYNAPYVLWHCYTLGASVMLARYLKMRTFWLIDLNHNWNLRPIFLDRQLIFVANAYIVLYALVALEYYIRHILGFREIVLVHSAYPYVGSGLAIFSLYMIVIQSISHLRGIELDA